MQRNVQHAVSRTSESTRPRAFVASADMSWAIRVASVVRIDDTRVYLTVCWDRRRSYGDEERLEARRVGEEEKES